jgi:predicted CXXCH cytochrome family protein
MPKHIVRLILILVAFLAIAYAGIVFLTDPSFYRFGHYRADSVPELAAGEPRFRGPDYCRGCHLDRHAEWSEGGHAKVKCEICHGPAGQHPATGKLPIPDDPVKLCTTCHEAMPARPAAQPQIVVDEHPFPHETPVVCSECHNPHAPGIGAPEAVVEPLQPEPEKPPLGAAGIPRQAAGCKGCHGAQGEGVGQFPPLAGIPVADFVKLMNEFKTGARPSPMMAALAQKLSDDDIRTLANYYASLGGEPE